MGAIDTLLRAEATDVLVRYATGIDSRDWALFRTCFTEDCDVDYGEIGHWLSCDEITTWMAETHEPFGPTMHRITNITFAGDQDAVTSRSYVQAVLVMPDRSSSIHAYGSYDDVVLRSGGGLRIARRLFTLAITEVHSALGS